MASRQIPAAQGETDPAHDVGALRHLGIEAGADSQNRSAGPIDQLGGDRRAADIDGDAQTLALPSGDSGIIGENRRRRAADVQQQIGFGAQPAGEPPSVGELGARKGRRGRCAVAAGASGHHADAGIPRRRVPPPQGNSTPWAASEDRRRDPRRRRERYRPEEAAGW